MHVDDARPGACAARTEIDVPAGDVASMPVTVAGARRHSRPARGALRYPGARRQRAGARRQQFLRTDVTWTTHRKPPTSRPPGASRWCGWCSRIPAASVVAAFALLVVAARSSGTDDLVADQVQRTAQIAGRRPRAGRERARTAAGRALVARGRRHDRGAAGAGRLRSRGAADAGAAPSARAPDRDRALSLATDGDRLAARTPKLDRAHDWNVQLAPADGGWRLQGRCRRKRVRRTTLRPRWRRAR